MRAILLTILGLVYLVQPARATPADDFDKFSEAFIHHYYSLHPVDGVSLGWHQYDAQFVVPTRTVLEEYARWLHAEQKALREYESAPFDPARRADVRILTGFIRTQLWTAESTRDRWHNPMTYAGALDINVYLKRDFKPLSERVRDIIVILHQAPALFAAARENLDDVLPAEYIETAIAMANGTATFLGNDVTKAFADVADANIKSAYAAASQTAQSELTQFVGWLNQERLPKADHGFAIGPKAFSEMLRGELIEVSPEHMLQIGLAELAAEQKRFDAAAHELDPEKPAAEVFQTLMRNHPSPEALIPDTRRDLENIRAVMVARKIVTIRSEVRAIVAETPPPFRSTTFASMDSPGPFETKGAEAFYYITPVEPEWPAAQKEEWLSAFNYNTMFAVSIHEVYPGHYVQFLALKASAATQVSKVFGSYAYIEGWAHYCEEMVRQAGFHQPADPNRPTAAERFQGAQFRLAQSAEALLRVCRLCCAIKMHTQGMTVDQATRFIMENCHYEEKPSHGEAMRGTYDPGYMFYTLGKLQIRKLRDDWQKQEGAHYSLLRFHDEFLRHGMPPIRALREEMLRDPQQWAAVLY